MANRELYKGHLMRIWLARLMLCGVLTLSPVAIAAEEQVSLNFVNADIAEVIKAISQITRRNFLVDPRVKGTINIVSSTPIPASMAYDTLLSALRLQGFAAVESNGVTKVMPEADAKLYISGVGDRSGSGDKLVTRVFMLHHESAVQLVPILRPLIAPNNIVVAYPNNNALVVTDYASNLKRIEQIVATLDQPQSAATTVIPVKYASVMDLAQIINRLMLDGSVIATGSTDASQRFMLMADARTNSLLLRTDSPARIARVQELAAKLDIQTSAPGNIHVVYLKNAEATRLAQTLRAVLSGDTFRYSQCIWRLGYSRYHYSICYLRHLWRVCGARCVQFVGGNACDGWHDPGGCGVECPDYYVFRCGI
jgi:general secretion pathway protein D